MSNMAEIDPDALAYLVEEKVEARDLPSTRQICLALNVSQYTNFHKILSYLK